MTNQRRSPQSIEQSFSAATYRQAMGPGYQVSTFREQPVILGTAPTRQVSVPVESRPRSPQRASLLRRWIAVLRVGRSARRQPAISASLLNLGTPTAQCC